MSQSFDINLDIEHEKFIESYNDEYPEGPPMGDFRIVRVEEFYVLGGSKQDEWSPITSNLRFYRRKRGKQAGKYVALYVNNKGKSIKAPVHAYIEKLRKELLSNEALARFGVSRITEAQHIREHTIRKIMKRQKETIGLLLKEREKLQPSSTRRSRAK